MPSKNTKLYSLILIGLDLLVLAIVFGAAYYVRTQLDSRALRWEVYANEYIFSFCIIAPIWIAIFAILGLYDARTYNRRLVEWGKIIFGTFLGILLVIGWEYATGLRVFPARLVTAYVFGGTIFSLITFRELTRFMRSLMYRYGRGVSRVLIIGNSLATKDIALELSATHKSGYQIVAFSGPRRLTPTELGIHHYQNVESALRDIKKLRISTIIQTDLYDDENRNHQILSAAQIHHIQYNFIPGEAEFYTGKNTVDVFLGYPMITVSQTPLIGWGAVFKRVFDVVASLLLMVAIGPIILLLSLLQMVFSPGPVFYVSKRLSQFSKPIQLIKFRTMDKRYGTQDAADEFIAMGRKDLAMEYRKNHKVENDPRITRFGRFLRETSLDELPQIFNVLRGDLSLVGPRPILPQEVKFNQSRTALLHSVKSGVTGLWQVSGRSNLSFDERIELELYYAQNWSFWLDIRILLKTIGVVMRKTGAK